MNSSEFQILVRGLANHLGIAPHSNRTNELEAVARLVRETVSGPSLPAAGGVPYPIKGGDKYVSDDKDVDQAAKILRLLQIHVRYLCGLFISEFLQLFSCLAAQHVRDLQTIINETIVAVQQLTADPRTDSKLGKTGF